jgi:predicted  nucleic acid-binding Zn-ribbon protein
LGLNVVAFATLVISLVEGFYLARNAWDRMKALREIKDEVKGLEEKYSVLKKKFEATFDSVRENIESIEKMLQNVPQPQE